LKAARAAGRKNFSGVEAAKLLSAFGIAMPFEVADDASQKQSDGAGLHIDIRHDAILGPVLSLGPAGDWPEALNDRTLAPLPMPRDLAIRSMQSLKGWPLLARTGGDEAIVEAGTAIENIGTAMLMLGSSLDHATFLLRLSSDGQSTITVADVALANE
jgi:hypothetical protein